LSFLRFLQDRKRIGNAREGAVPGTPAGAEDYIGPAERARPRQPPDLRKPRWRRFTAKHEEDLRDCGTISNAVRYRYVLSYKPPETPAKAAAEGAGGETDAQNLPGVESEEKLKGSVSLTTSAILQIRLSDESHNVPGTLRRRQRSGGVRMHGNCGGVWKSNHHSTREGPIAALKAGEITPLSPPGEVYWICDS